MQLYTMRVTTCILIKSSTRVPINFQCETPEARRQSKEQRRIYGAALRMTLHVPLHNRFLLASVPGAAYQFGTGFYHESQVISAISQLLVKK